MNAGGSYVHRKKLEVVVSSSPRVLQTGTRKGSAGTKQCENREAHTAGGSFDKIK